MVAILLGDRLAFFFRFLFPLEHDSSVCPLRLCSCPFCLAVVLFLSRISGCISDTSPFSVVVSFLPSTFLSLSLRA